MLFKGTGTPKRSILSELNRESGAANSSNPPLGNSPRAQHNSLEGGLDNFVLLNLSTPPTGGGGVPAKAPLPGGAAEPPFERTNKNRASERYHIPHKKAAKEQGGANTRGEEDKENFATPETPR